MIGRLLQTAATTFGQGGQQRGQQLHSAHQLESVTEEAHTRDLLFPDAAALRTSQHSAIPFHTGRVPATPREAANHDDRGGLDINYPTDIRVIIAQDQNARYPTQILFDSMLGRQPCTSPHGQELGPAASQRLHVRGKSFSTPYRPNTRPAHQAGSPSTFHADGPSGPTSPLSPEPRRTSVFGAAGHLRTQTTDFQGHGQDVESSQARLAREKEEADALLNCIFGSPGMRLESGTKLHVLPRNFPNADRAGSRMRPFSPSGGGGGGGGGGSGGNARNQRTGANRSTNDASRPQPPTSVPPSQSRTAVMITKLFNVQLPETTVADVEPHHADSNDQTDPGRPGTAQSKSATDETQRVKQKKTPMYAVAVIIQLPTDHFPRTRSNPMPGMAPPLSTSFQLSAPNSPSSSIQIPAFGSMDQRVQVTPAGIDSGVSVHISYILAHWGLMSRNIHLLEFTAQNRLRHLLENVVPLAPAPVTSQGKTGNIKLRRPKLPSQQAVCVAADALQEDLQIRKQADEAAYNVAFGLRAKRVVPGQGRWGAWREEARWVSRWAGSREQNFFFFTFITAFLGQHTNWLEHVAPRPYRHRARRNRLLGLDDSDILPERTVVICSDKMAARRLVFLAASFMPTALKTNPPAFMRPHLASFNLGESPPVLSNSREQPRRAAARRDSPVAVANTLPGAAHARSVSFSVAADQHHHHQHPDEATTDEIDDEDRMSFGERLGRRVSEAGSVRSTFTNLPNATRESGKGTTSTILAESALPVAHFTSLSPQSRREPVGPRPGSNGSIASVALNSVIRRSESSNAGSTSSLGGRFGSMMSGFWSTAPGSSTDGSTNDLPSTLSPDKAVQNRKLQLSKSQSTSGARQALRSPTKLDRMVEEASHFSKGSPVDRSRSSGAALLGQSPGTARQPLDLDYCLKKTPSNTDEKMTAARRIPARPEPERMPITLSMNEEDGFVDVSMPQGMSINSSLASSYTSLRMSSFGHSIPYGSGNTTWNSSGDVSEQQHQQQHLHQHHSPYGSPSFTGTATAKPEAPPNVAGWLRTFHPDFVLQAVRPYEGVNSDIKRALEVEAKMDAGMDGDSEEEDDGQWKKVCSILVADTTRFTVEKHTILRRKRKINERTGGENLPNAHTDVDHDHNPPPFILSPSASTTSLHGSETEEQITTEPLMDMDPTLIDAIERVLAQSGPSSRAVSRVQSRAPSPSRSRPVSVKGAAAQQSLQISNATVKQEQAHQQERASSSTTAPPQTEASVAGGRTPVQVPFPECRKIIMGALEDIVKNVIEERELSQSATVVGPRKGAVLLSGAGVDGALREGVASWLSKVEGEEDV